MSAVHDSSSLHCYISLCRACSSGCQHDATTFAAEPWRLQHGTHSVPAAIDRYLLSAGRSAANPPATIAAVYHWDRRTDGRPTVTYTLLHILMSI